MATDLNSISIIGRATNDPELKHTQNGTALVNFSLASNRDFKDNKEVLFIKCSAWSKTAELIHQYLKKSDKCAILGRLKQNEWEDKEGKKRKDIEIVISDIYFLNGKKPEEASSDEPF